MQKAPAGMERPWAAHPTTKECYTEDSRRPPAPPRNHTADNSATLADTAAQPAPDFPEATTTMLTLSPLLSSPAWAITRPVGYAHTPATATTPATVTTPPPAASRQIPIP